MKFKEYRKKKFLENESYRKAYLDIKENKNIKYVVSSLITEARRYKGITQKELAELINTKQPSIARIENGDTLPNISFLNKIAKAIGTNLIIKWGFMDYEDSDSNFYSNSENVIIDKKKCDKEKSPYFKSTGDGLSEITEELIFV